MLRKIRSSLSRSLPPGARRWLSALRRGRLPPPRVNGVNFGDLRRLTPIGHGFGGQRGTPVDRYYIETFLERNRARIRGRVLEVSEETYTRRFGGAAVTRIDVLHVDDPAPPVTILADLADAPQIPSDTFDCIIVTQTLMLIYDTAAAVATLHRILKPGGTVLVTTAGLTQVADRDWAPTWYWGFSGAAARRMFGEVFGADRVAVEVYGNVLSTVAFLHGLTVEELRPGELDHRDPEYQMLIGVAARKAEGGAAAGAGTG